MAPMAYRSCLFMHWCPELAFYGAKSSKLGSVPRIQAASPAPSSLQLLLTVCCASPSCPSTPMRNLGELALSALDCIQMIKCLCHRSLLPNSKQYQRTFI